MNLDDFEQTARLVSAFVTEAPGILSVKACLFEIPRDSFAGLHTLKGVVDVFYLSFNHARDALQERARRVVPNGVYGHQSNRRLPQGSRNFSRASEGSRIWDVDGNEYIDFMCAYGPIVLGHRHRRLRRPSRPENLGEVFNGPSEQW